MTDQEDFLNKWHLERMELFKAQDLHNGFFDVVFDVEGKKIYANKILLAPISSQLKELFSEVNHGAIKINFLYNDFFQFLIFLYSGRCDINEENIVSMVQMAVTFEVEDLRKECDDFLYSLRYSPKTIFNYFEELRSFDLPHFEDAVYQFLFKYVTSLDSPEFLKLKPDTVHDLVSTFEELHVFSEEMFTAVYRWAETRAMNHQNSTKKRKLDVNEVIKNELVDILPYFEFADMNRKFLDENVVRKGFLFSYDELSNMLSSANKSRVEVSNEMGHRMYGRILDNHEVINAIKIIQDSDEEHSHRDPSFEGCFWRTQIVNVPTSSTLKKSKNVDYYLLINSDGDICVKMPQEINENDYLLAEMVTAYEFIFNDCKINIV